MTQKTLAARSGLTPSHLNRIEKSTRNPPLPGAVLAMIEALRLTQAEAEELLQLAGYSPMLLQPHPNAAAGQPTPNASADTLPQFGDLPRISDAILKLKTELDEFARAIALPKTRNGRDAISPPYPLSQVFSWNTHVSTLTVSGATRPICDLLGIPQPDFNGSCLIDKPLRDRLARTLNNFGEWVVILNNTLQSLGDYWPHDSTQYQALQAFSALANTFPQAHDQAYRSPGREIRIPMRLREHDLLPKGQIAEFVKIASPLATASKSRISPLFRVHWEPVNQVAIDLCNRILLRFLKEPSAETTSESSIISPPAIPTPTHPAFVIRHRDLPTLNATEPMLIVRAPLRLSFGGGPTDLEAYYSRYGGLMVSTTINKYVYASISQISSDSIELFDHGLFAKYHAADNPLKGDLPLLKALVKQFGLEGGLKIVINSELPPGTGLGSTGAATVALTTALSTLRGDSLFPEKVAEISYHTEYNLLRAPVGAQDPYAAAFGGLNAFTFGRDGVQVEPLSISDDRSRKLESTILLFFVRISHNAEAILRKQKASTEQNQRTIEVLDNIKAIAEEIRHSVKAGDIERFGHALHTSWQYKKQLVSGISDDFIDGCYDDARRAGAIGGKVAGAGGGGFLMLCCPEFSHQAVIQAMEAKGLRRMDFRFDPLGANVLSNTMTSAIPFPTAAPPTEGQWRRWQKELEAPDQASRTRHHKQNGQRDPEARLVDDDDLVPHVLYSLPSRT